ncbi:MAG: protein kinase [Phycisphaerae bacterium]
MAYVEVWKSGRLITRRRVDEQKAQKGCRVRLGSAGEVRVAIGQSETLGELEVRMFAGEPPPAWQEAKKTVSKPAQDDQSLTPLSVETPGLRVEQMDRYPDIEGYKIIEPLGEGGMGIVWRAEQLSTRRQVALKLMVSHRIESPKAQARFQREVELTARLDHPNIARIYESGLHQGMYYYAMELVNGIPLDRYVKSKALSRHEILALMRMVCQAVLFAHLRAVIHRDLKPSNILVSPDGQPHVLDFGLAKALLEEDEALTISVEGQIAGTPAYMSPEQAAGHHSQIDTRTDVFSLGVILYELLTGQSPHDLSGSTFDVLHRIMEGKIQRPREITKTMDCELEALLLKALAQNPEDRYASAGALAKDINNYLNGEPLDAQVPTILYFLRKKALKYRVQVAIGLAVSFIFLGIILVAYTKIVSERAVREAQAVELELKSKELTWAELELKALGSNQKEAQAALRILRDEYLASQKNVDELQQKLDQQVALVPTKRINLKRGEPLSPTALVRQPALPQGVQSWTLETLGHRGNVNRIAYSPNGRWLASGSSDGTLRLWDSDSGQLTKILIDSNDTVDLPWVTDGREADRFSWSADGQTRTLDEIIILWEIDLPDIWQSLQRSATAVALSPDRAMLAFGDRDSTIRVLNTKSGQLRHTNIPAWCGPVHSVRFSSDSKVLATSAGSGTICLWDAHRWQPLRKFETDSITGGFSPSVSTISWDPGDTVIARPNNHQDALEILDSQSGQVLRVLYGNSQKIASVAWSPDGTLLAAGTIDGKAHLWDIKSDSNEPFVTLDARTGRANTVTWHPDGQSLITAGEDGNIKLWEPHTGKLTHTFDRHTGPITCLAPSPNGKVLASGSPDGTIRLWDVTRSRIFNLLRNEPNAPQAGQSAFTAVAWSPNGTLLASGDSGGNIQIWDPNSRQPRRSFSANCGSIKSLAWSPDGHVLMCGGADGSARAWDARNDFQEHVVLLPLWGSAGPGIAINREGDYRGPPGIAEHLIYVVSTERGQETLTPADFKSRFGWVNEPWQVGLYTPSLEQVKRIYVKADAEPPYDGNSWDTAFNDLQDALKVAQPNTDIWVAAGIYSPDRGTGAREASFRLKNGVRLFGGFSGTETNIDRRDPNRNETILSGDLKGNDGPNFTNNDENSYNVVLASNTDSSTVLDGFVITGGNANGPGHKRTDNFNHHGGGLGIRECSLTLIRCAFKYNSAVQYGGGIFNYGGWPILQNCAFTTNRALYDGGAICSHWSKSVVIGCTFVKNSADHYGGGVYIALDSSMFIDCTFTGNFAPAGGGLHITNSQSNPTLANCSFLENSADMGGGVYVAGSNAKFINCLFNNNSAVGRGGGIYTIHRPTKPMLYNCTIVGNKSLYPGCGIDNDPNGSPVLVNCIVWNNTDGNKTSESEQIRGGFPVINNCCIQGWSGQLGGSGNFALNPLFVDPDGIDKITGTLDDNFRLDLASPCRNAGNNSALPADTADLDKDGDVNEPIPFDIEGKPRILNGVVDLGAFENG